MGKCKMKISWSTAKCTGNNRQPESIKIEQLESSEPVEFVSPSQVESILTQWLNRLKQLRVEEFRIKNYLLSRVITDFGILELNFNVAAGFVNDFDVLIYSLKIIIK